MPDVLAQILAKISRLEADQVIATLTVVAVSVAAAQLYVNGRIARQNFARQMWLDYIKTGIKYPELGETRTIMALMGTNDPIKTVDGFSIYSHRYEWFLTLVLDTCENVIRYLPSRDWRTTVVRQIWYHRQALTVGWAGYKPYYTKKLAKLVDEALRMGDDLEQSQPFSLDGLSDRFAPMPVPTAPSPIEVQARRPKARTSVRLKSSEAR